MTDQSKWGRNFYGAFTYSLFSQFESNPSVFSFLLQFLDRSHSSHTQV